mmetsp:Transcript_24070/g.44438  ORF Transcript_24070/g.44438 Transcript_24070/m.44438 type:complete len:90 (+) Transcript_24070:167-436(+)
MSYSYRDPKQEAREFIARHLEPGDLLPHLAMYFEIASSAIEPLLELDLTPEQRDHILTAGDKLRVGFHICAELPHHGQLIPHVTKQVDL